jgi:hypothetical protein
MSKSLNTAPEHWLGRGSRTLLGITLALLFGLYALPEGTFTTRAYAQWCYQVATPHGLRCRNPGAKCVQDWNNNPGHCQTLGGGDSCECVAKSNSSRRFRHSSSR